MRQRFVLVCLIVLSASVTSAKVFQNAYISFDMPNNWKCVLEHTEWVCRSEADKESKEAIIILTAKEVGPTDSLETYTRHLNTPQTSTAKSGASQQSQIKSPAKQSKVNDQVWIDSLHLHGEVPNYFTRYLATIKNSIAVLVTYSVHNDHYAKYSQDFYNSILSLRILATANTLNSKDLGPIRGANDGPIGGPINSAWPDDSRDTMPAPPTEGGGGGQTKLLLMGLAILLVGAAVFILMKMKKR